jgi:SnoaL-like domain
MLANWEAMLAGIPGFCAGICRSVQDGDRTWTEWRWSGTRSDGQAFEMRGVTLFEVTGGQIVAGRLYLEDVERASPVSSRPCRTCPVAGPGPRTSSTARRLQPATVRVGWARAHPPAAAVLRLVAQSRCGPT